MSSGQATTIPPNEASAATAILHVIATTDAPGMSQQGNPFAGQFEEGDALEQTITVEIDKEHALIAACTDGIQQLDMTVSLTVPGHPPRIVAQTSTSGPSAMLGPWENPAPQTLPMQVVLTATAGSGVVAAQVYVKSM